MALTTKLVAAVNARQTTALDLATASADVAKRYSVELATGTGAGQADLIFHDQRTLAASANEDLDLAGVLTGALGGTLTFARVKAVLIAAAAANTNDVVLGGAASNTFVGMFGAATHTVRVRPGGMLLIAAGQGDPTGYAVTAATGDLLRVANGGAGTSVTYDVIVIGASA